ncbi:MAG TPA: hypothetical protein VH186_14360 [Chloroflexia bacterium]|nr:hypothetical protein [Chloroflexia bacterium]
MTQLDNPAAHEVYEVDYTVVFPDERMDRFSGNFQHEGAQPTRQDIVRELSKAQRHFAWQSADHIIYITFRLMNNDARIEVERDQIPVEELESATSPEYTASGAPASKVEPASRTPEGAARPSTYAGQDFGNPDRADYLASHADGTPDQAF